LNVIKNKKPKTKYPEHRGTSIHDFENEEPWIPCENDGCLACKEGEHEQCTQSHHCKCEICYPDGEEEYA